MNVKKFYKPNKKNVFIIVTLLLKDKNETPRPGDFISVTLKNDILVYYTVYDSEYALEFDLEYADELEDGDDIPDFLKEITRAEFEDSKNTDSKEHVFYTATYLEEENINKKQ